MPRLAPMSSKGQRGPASVKGGSLEGSSRFSWTLVLAVLATGASLAAAVLWGSMGAMAGGAVLTTGAAVWWFRSRREGAPSDRSVPLDDRASESSPSSTSMHARLRSVIGDRNRFENTLASIVEGVVAVDQSGRLTQINGSAARFLNATMVTDLGSPFSEICTNREVNELVARALETKRFHRKEVVIAGVVLDCYAGPLAEETGAVLVLHDITEVRRLELIRRDFVANVSHELKTPLTAIKGYVETLLDGGLDDRENNLRFLKKVEVHANRLTALITDLLSLSRIESGDAITRKEPVEVALALNASVNRLAPSAEKKSVRLGVRALEPEVRIVGDTEALNQIFDNLIDNAIKYTESGGRVDVTLSRANGKVVFEVTDTGVGIPEEELPRIFERFYRVDKARSRELGGTGLGLSIVRHLVNALDGEVSVRSKLGSGSTFTVSLPLYERDSQPVAGATSGREDA